MPAKIRLQRFGKKGQPYYRIVVADSRAPRDGRFIENIGTYNPLTIPATIQIDQAKALYWLQVGAQPTDTAKAILSYKGILYKNHLLKGVKKGALTEEQAEAKFAEWLSEKENRIQRKIKDKELKVKELGRQKIEDEKQVSETRAQEIAEKRAKLAAKEAAANAEPVVDEAPLAEEPVAEAPVAETQEPAQDAVEDSTSQTSEE